MTNEKYITIKELAELKGVSTRAIRLSRGKYQTQDVVVKGGRSFEILLSSIEPELQEKYYSKFVPIIQKMITSKQPLNTILTGSEKADERNEVSSESEQIEDTVPKAQMRNSPSTKLFQDSEQQKKSLKRKIRKDFYKIKQEMKLENYKLDDLRFCNKIDN